jgi:excisionase family DNA binding protein
MPSRPTDPLSGAEADPNVFAVLEDALRKLTGRLDSAADNRQLIDMEEVARRLNCSSKTVKRLVASGQLPSVRLERLRRVRVSDLDEFVKRLGA